MRPDLLTLDPYIKWFPSAVIWVIIAWLASVVAKFVNCQFFKQWLAAVFFDTLFSIRLLALSSNFITLWIVSPDVVEPSIQMWFIFRSWLCFASQAYGGTNGETVVFWTWRYFDHGFLCERDKIKTSIPIHINSRFEKRCYGKKQRDYALSGQASFVIGLLFRGN